MPRNPNIDLRNRVLEFIKREYMKAGKPVSLSLAAIAKGVGEDPRHSEKIMRVVNALERGLSITIDHGEGSRSNIYTFNNDSSKMFINEAKEQMIVDIDEKLFAVNHAMQKLVECYGVLSKMNIDLMGENEYLKSGYLELEPSGNLADGTPLFKTQSRNSTLSQVIEGIRLEKEANQQAATVEE